jgi:quinol monooxygenase YgiN
LTPDSVDASIASVERGDASTADDVSGDDCAVVELRRYALRPGHRDLLIELFDRELVETQEAVGMRVLGQFRDLDDPDSFVWMRGFADMESRRRALESFYGGPAWKEHARAANATMLDSDNVLLLRPVRGLEFDLGRRAPRASTVDPPGLIAVTIWPLKPAVADDGPSLFEELLEPALRDLGAAAVATYETEHGENTFPALPVRENENVFVWISIFESDDDHARHLRALEGSPGWRDAWESAAAYSAAPLTMLRLEPTSRSALHA